MQPMVLISTGFRCKNRTAVFRGVATGYPKEAGYSCRTWTLSPPGLSAPTPVAHYLYRRPKPMRRIMMTLPIMFFNALTAKHNLLTLFSIDRKRKQIRNNKGLIMKRFME
jgi:hypothetical protein